MSAFATDHAQERAHMRHGIDPTEADWAGALLDILDGRALLQRRSPRDGCERWLVRLCGVVVAVAYSPVQATIITVLPDFLLRRRT